MNVPTYMDPVSPAPKKVLEEKKAGNITDVKRQSFLIGNFVASMDFFSQDKTQ